MAEQAEQVSTTGLMDTKQPKRQQYSEALKREMVAETQVLGVSVSIVARRHDVNSNQLFRWRRQLLPKAAVESSVMVPVEIAADGDRPRRPDDPESAAEGRANRRPFAGVACGRADPGTQPRAERCIQERAADCLVGPLVKLLSSSEYTVDPTTPIFATGRHVKGGLRRREPVSGRFF
jgi:transposase-like protein